MWLLLTLACSSPSAAPATSEPAAAAAPAEPDAPTVLAAREHMGRRYAFGGRSEQLDCMGLVFLAWSDATGRPWRELSVNPTELVAKGQLGPPVEGLAGVPTAQIDYGLLRSGDVIFFLGPAENPNEPALAALDGAPHWAWHMGMWTGGPDRSFIVGDHFVGAVAELHLPLYLARHSDQYAGIFVVRPPLPPPRRSAGL